MAAPLTSTARTIVRDAAMLINAIPAGGSLSPQEEQDCLRILNIMMKSWQSKEFLWKHTDVTVTLTPGTQSYLVGPGGTGTLNRVRPLRLKYAIRRADNIDIEVELISREEYQRQPNKTQQGPVVTAYYDPQLTNGVLYVWYTGDATNNTIICTFADPVDLFDAVGDSPDLPDEWVEPITYNLAPRIAPMFGVPTPPDVIAVANSSLIDMENFDSEIADINFMPSRRHR